MQSRGKPDMAALGDRLGDALAMLPEHVLSFVASLVGDQKPDVHRSKKRKATSEDMYVDKLATR